MNNFLILGLPRSRTAWLANFMTYDGLTCTHEGLNGCHTLKQYRDKFSENTGDSNTGLILFDFEEYFTGFKIIIIDNEIDAAVEFSKKNYGFDSTQMLLIIKEKLLALDGLHIEFKDINDRLEEIWNYITNKQFNRKRAEMLKGLDVQIIDPHSMDETAMLALRNNEYD